MANSFPWRKTVILICTPKQPMSTELLEQVQDFGLGLVLV
jgi:hypothetical protein